MNSLPKIKIEDAVADENEEVAVNIIAESVGTGEIGNGKIFVYSLQDAVRIRTGEKKDEAIS